MNNVACDSGLEAKGGGNERVFKGSFEILEGFQYNSKISDTLREFFKEELNRLYQRSVLKSIFIESEIVSIDKYRNSNLAVHFNLHLSSEQVGLRYRSFSLKKTLYTILSGEMNCLSENFSDKTGFFRTLKMNIREMEEVDDTPAESKNYIKIKYDEVPCPNPLEFKSLGAKRKLHNKLLELKKIRYDPQKIIRSCKTVKSTIASDYVQYSTKAKNGKLTSKIKKASVKERVFKCSFVVKGDKYDTKFADTNSDVFQERAKFYKMLLNRLYKCSKFKDIFKKSEILSLNKKREDDLVVQFNIHLSLEHNMKHRNSTFFLTKSLQDILFEEIECSKIGLFRNLKIDSIQIQEEADDKLYLSLNLPNLQFCLEKHLRCLMITKSCLEQYQSARIRSVRKHRKANKKVCLTGTSECLDEEHKSLKVAKHIKSNKREKMPMTSGCPIPGFMRTSGSLDEGHNSSLKHKSFGYLIPDISIKDTSFSNKENCWSPICEMFLEYQEDLITNFSDSMINESHDLLKESLDLYVCFKNKLPNTGEELEDFFTCSDVVKALELVNSNEDLVDSKELSYTNKELVSSKELSYTNKELADSEELSYTNEEFIGLGENELVKHNSKLVEENKKLIVLNDKELLEPSQPSDEKVKCDYVEKMELINEVIKINEERVKENVREENEKRVKVNENLIVLSDKELVKPNEIEESEQSNVKVTNISDESNDEFTQPNEREESELNDLKVIKVSDESNKEFTQPNEIEESELNDLKVINVSDESNEEFTQPNEIEESEPNDIKVINVSDESNEEFTQRNEIEESELSDEEVISLSDENNEEFTQPIEKCDENNEEFTQPIEKCDNNKCSNFIGDLDKFFEVEEFPEEDHEIEEQLLSLLRELKLTNETLLLKKEKLVNRVMEQKEDAEGTIMYDLGVKELWKSLENHLSSDLVDKRESIEKISETMKDVCEKHEEVMRKYEKLQCWTKSDPGLKEYIEL